MTDAEKRLWSVVRRDRLGVRFRRQHPIGRWIVDFYAAPIRLAVEIDGGGHSERGSADASRTAALNALGVSVLRFWNNEVLCNLHGVVEALSKTVEICGNRASPLTPLRCGGGDASCAIGAMNLRLSLAENSA